MRDQPSGPRASASPPSVSASGSASATATLAPPRPRTTPAAGSALPTINVVVERWDEIITAVRTTRVLLAPFVEQAVPSGLAASGALTIRAEDAAGADALDAGMGDLLSAVREMFPAIQRIIVARPEGAAPAAAPRRVTEEEIRAQRMALLRKQDPVLGAAIDALDLELLD